MYEVKKLVKKFDKVKVLKEIDLDIKEGEKIVIIGPSGSGKSTLLRCLGRLESPTSGKIYFNNKDITKIHNTHEIGMVFQSFNLFENLTVLENITLAPIKTKLLNEFNLHTVIRMPHSVFAPYTSITTNILFFDNTHPTTETWFYRMDMPEGYKNFSKTKPILLEHFKPVEEWWNNREEIEIDGFFKAKKFTKQELADRNYNIDLCGYPHEEEEILDPHDLIRQFKEKRAQYNQEMEDTLNKILELLDEDN